MPSEPVNPSGGRCTLEIFDVRPVRSDGSNPSGAGDTLTDSRSFYLNAAMNGLTKEGYEFAGMSSDDVVMKRPVTHP